MGASGQAVALGDVDGDGFVDAVRARFRQPNQVCLGDGNLGFTCSDVEAAAFDTWNVALGDIDGNGTLDAVFASLESNRDATRVCLGDGSGGFNCSRLDLDPFTFDLLAFGVALGDVDGNGDLDAVFAQCTQDRVCLGDGTGTFSCSDIDSDVEPTIDVALDDLDNDDDLDAVFAFSGPSRICLGDGTGSFSCTVIAPGFSSDQVALGDLDGDTVPDAVFTAVTRAATRHHKSAALPTSISSRLRFPRRLRRRFRCCLPSEGGFWRSSWP